MTIERINNEIVIRMPGNIDIEELQRLINLLIYKEVTVNSVASQDEVDELASAANKGWWEQNKDRFLRK
ncbi:MAG: hypothetical protein R2828_35610 [Saprospiraceae bacterium]